jgi:3-deoxy-D-manno-octulosonate 8-phosphate phosphatase (KDO 8-P phosphatase)
MSVNSLPHDQLVERAKTLEWLLLDVDGVFTDGRLIYGADGERWKVFDVHDGLGLRFLQRGGVKVGILSGRMNEALEFRAREIDLDAVIMDRSDKGPAFAEFLDGHGVDPRKVAYMGDDLLDLPVMRLCGLSFAPADAVSEVRQRVDQVLERRGGYGVVRELCELLLRARGQWDELIAPLLNG